MPTIPIDTSGIAQQSFRFMELTELSSFADTSPQVQAAAAQYETAIDMVLERHDWSAARRIAFLAPFDLPDREAADPQLEYLYRLPADLVALRWVQAGVTWRRDGVILRTDHAGGLLVRYTRQLRIENHLPARVRTAVALQLAVLLAPRYVASRTKRADLANELEAAIERAMETDRLSGSTDQWDGEPVIDWVAEALR